MEPTTIAISVAVAAGVLAIIVAIVRACKPKEDAGSTYFAAPQAAQPRAAQPTKPLRAKRKKNRKGWMAPEDYWFDDDDVLYGPDGIDVFDLAMIAQLCNADWDATAAVEEAVSEPAHEIPAPVSEPEPVVAAEVSPSTSFSDLQTDESRYSGGFGGGSYDSGGGCDSFDSGGGDCGGGDD